MRPRRQTRPPGSLPILAHGQTLQFERGIDGDDAVDFAVGVLVVLARVDFVGVEVDGRDGHVERLGCGEGDLGFEF